MTLSRRPAVAAALAVAVLGTVVGVGVATTQPTTGSPGSGSGYAVFAFVRGLVGGLLAVLGTVSALGMVLGRLVTAVRRGAGSEATHRYDRWEFTRRLLGFAVVAAIGAGVAAGGTAYWGALVLLAVAALVVATARARAVAWGAVATVAVEVVRQVVAALTPGSRR